MKATTKNQPRARRTLSERLRRLALLLGLGLVGLYGIAVAAGYGWLRYGRQVEQITVLDVALLQTGSVRRGIAVQHFVKAQTEWTAKQYQAAHLAFTAGMNNDPDNIAGRLEAARFLRSVGATNLEQNVLQDGLGRARDDRRLIEATFAPLFADGQEKKALDLWRRLYGTNYSGPEARLLQAYEIRATLAVEGGEAAKKLLEKNPDLLTHVPAAPVVAKVWWETAQRLRAIELLARHVRTAEAAYENYAELAGWQQAGGQPESALQTAQMACAKFPDSVAAQVLLIETRAAISPDGRPSAADLENFLRKHAGQNQPLALLATLAGRKGWLDLTRSLYALAANTQPDLGPFALAYADALARNDRFEECQQLLAQIESQAEKSSAAFMLQLRLRQVIAAGALRDTANLRELARRLAVVFRANPEGLDGYRRYFQKVGLTEVVEELSPRAKPTKATL